MPKLDLLRSRSAEVDHPGTAVSMAKAKGKIRQPARRPLAPMAGGAPDPCLEIDAAEFEQARRDPVVRRLLEKADRYADSLRSQGRLQD
jgi:hypothetical protein